MKKVFYIFLYTTVLQACAELVPALEPPAGECGHTVGEACDEANLCLLATEPVAVEVQGKAASAARLSRTVERVSFMFIFCWGSGTRGFSIYPVNG